MPPQLRHAPLLGAICLALACGPAEAPAPPPPEVLVVEVVARDVPVISEWLGTTEGSVDAEIRAQVSGYLISRDYREGSRVEQGALLFRIDPRPVPGHARPGAGRPRPRRGGARAVAPRRGPLHAARRVGRGEPPGVRHRGAAPALERGRASERARGGREGAHRPRLQRDPLADRRRRSASRSGSSATSWARATPSRSRPSRSSTRSACRSSPRSRSTCATRRASRRR